MGMDVNGRKPTTKAGEYFSSSIFNWPTVLAAMSASGLDVPASWAYSDGDGLKTQEECSKYADKLDAQFADLIGVPVILQADNMGNKLLEILGSEPVHNVTIEMNRLHRWIEFLRGCGGFTIS